MKQENHHRNFGEEDAARRPVIDPFQDAKLLTIKQK